MSSDGPVKNQGFSVFNTVGAAGVTNQVPTFPRWLSLLPHGQELLRADARAGGHRRCTDCLLPTVPWSMMGRSIGPRSCVGHWGLFFLGSDLAMGLNGPYMAICYFWWRKKLQHFWEIMRWRWLDGDLQWETVGFFGTKVSPGMCI